MQRITIQEQFVRREKSPTKDTTQNSITQRNQMKSRFPLFVLLGLSATGCSLVPEFQRPEMELAPRYIEESALEDSFANLAWWNVFKDPTLQDVIRLALAENRDIKLAAARMEEVRAILGFTRADQFPRVMGSGAGSRFDPSDQKNENANGPRNNFRIGADLSFEIDFWGRLSGATEAARAELLASQEAYRFVTISLISQVASTYFTISDLDTRLAIAKRTFENRAGATGVIQARFDKGEVAEIDLNQAQIEEADAAITAAATERELRTAQNALRVLLGNSSYSIPRPAPLMTDDLPASIPAVFPAELLNRRPDLLSAEASAKSKVALIGVAKAERLPIFSLLGAIGFGSNKSHDLLTKNALMWNIGGQFIGPIIDFGKAKSKVEIAEAQAKQALLTYEQTVLQAVQEVEDALVEVRTYRVENAERNAQVKASSNAATLSRARYNDGFTSYLEVLDVERSLFDAELGASNTKQLYLNSIVKLYRSLGGGWSNTPETAGPLLVEVKGVDLGSSPKM